VTICRFFIRLRVISRQMTRSDYIRGLREEWARAVSKTRLANKLVARDAMIEPVFLLPEDNGRDIVKKLKAEETNVCIVITKEGKFLGEISDQDLIILLLAQVEYEPLTRILNIGYMRELAKMKAKDLVNKHRTTVSLDTPINKVIGLAYKEGFHYIPVLDKNRKVRGVVTPSSLLDLLEEY